MKYLYKYPHAAFPYAQLVEENRRRDKHSPEFELMDTGVFSENRYFDVSVEYGKNTPEEILVRITVANRGPERAEMHLLPTVWFRNTWSWGTRTDRVRPCARWTAPLSWSMEISDGAGFSAGGPELLFTENETNLQRLFGVPNRLPYVKDGINEYVVNGASAAVDPARTGTKAAARYVLDLGPGETQTVRLRLARPSGAGEPFGGSFDAIFAERIREPDEFYSTVIPADLSPDARNVMRQALAGMLWSKQFRWFS